ncbi:hypothetical protein MKW92_020618 [Papaver armeniacum]|nr:hypothetical protein MKW92_020618 [Papaver armeniacum]
MSATNLGDDDDSRLMEEMTEIQTLLKGFIESQAIKTEFREKFAKSQAQQAKAHAQSEAQEAKSQEDIDNQILQVLRSISKHQDITEASGSAGKEKQASKVEEKVVRATYKPDRNDLLLKGDCKKTIQFLKNNPEALTHGVTRSSSTVLHVAIYSKREMKLIEEIVRLSSPELLEYRAGDQDKTALHYAALFGNAKAVALLVTKNPRLPLLHDKRGFTAFEVAISIVTRDQKEILECLYPLTIDVDPTPFTGFNGAWHFCRLIECNFYGGYSSGYDYFKYQTS